MTHSGNNSNGSNNTNYCNSSNDVRGKCKKKEEKIMIFEENVTKNRKKSKKKSEKNQKFRKCFNVGGCNFFNIGRISILIN